MTGSNPIAGYSKDHADGGAPFSGPDAVALATGMPDEPNKPQKPEQPTAAPLCIDCRYCTDLDVPRRPGNLICAHPDPYLRTAIFYVGERRRSESYCGEGGRWFEDALQEDQADDF